MPDASEGFEGLDALQRDMLGYFVHEANPANGLVRDNTRYGAQSSIAAVGFGLACYPVAVERGVMTREEAASRTVATLRFFHDAPQGPEPDATGYRGFFYHFLDMQTGRRVHYCELSTMDTAILLAGALTAAAYFDHPGPPEREIRRLADALYRRVDWRWAQDGSGAVSHGWTPEQGFLRYHWRGYSEALMRYALGLGSPTHPLPAHPLPAKSYAAWTRTYRWKKLYGFEFLCSAPLFTHQLSHLWIDFRGIQDAYMRSKAIDYFENSRRATYVQQQYAIHNPRDFVGYGRYIWGITASDGPGNAVRTIRGRKRRFYDYVARGVPYGPDDGTLSPWAVVAALPFARDRATRHPDVHKAVSRNAQSLRLPVQLQSDVSWRRAVGVDRERLLRPRPGALRAHDRELSDRSDLASYAALSVSSEGAAPCRIHRRLAGMKAVVDLSGEAWVRRHD